MTDRDRFTGDAAGAGWPAGEWRAEGLSLARALVLGPGKRGLIATVHTPDPPESALGTALLLARAKDMYEALRQIAYGAPVAHPYATEREALAEKVEIAERAIKRVIGPPGGGS